MPEFTISMSEDQDEIMREMGVKEFGLDVTCTSKEVLDYIILNNTHERANRKLDGEWAKLDLKEKAEKLERQGRPIE